MSRELILERIRTERICAIIRALEEEVARDAMDAAVEGGFRFVEVTFNTPGAERLITRLAKRSELLVGAGTIMNVDEVDRAVGAGAKVIVSPIFDPAVVAAAGAHGCVTIPGTFTPTEMVTARRGGADLVKLFPAPANVADFIKSVLAPLPELGIVPTAGVTESNFVEILDAGAVAVGFVRSLFVPSELASKSYRAIETRARSIVERVRSPRIHHGAQHRSESGGSTARNQEPGTGI